MGGSIFPPPDGVILRLPSSARVNLRPGGGVILAPPPVVFRG